MLKPILLFIGTSLLTMVAAGNPITYNVKIDTSSIAGTAGSLDFNFNPGPLVTQSAALQIAGFSTDGTLTGTPALIGDVSGTLPGTVTFDNGSGFNDYFKNFKYGSNLSFNVSIYGSALSSPNGTATSGSTVAFSMFSDPAGTVPALTSNVNDGFAATVNVNLDGSTTVTNYSSETSIMPQSAVPEIDANSSAGALTLLTGVLLIIRGGRRKPDQKKGRHPFGNRPVFAEVSAYLVAIVL